MAGISTGIAGIAAVACGLIALASVPAAEMRHRPVQPEVSLCAVEEKPLFSCAIGKKHVSVCGHRSGAVYRFGQPGRTELTSRHLTIAIRGFAGGGETQITATNKGHSYTVYDRMSRTAFGDDGRHDAAASSGLLVRRGGRVLSAKRCDQDAPISSQAEQFIKLGPFVPH